VKVLAGFDYRRGKTPIHKLDPRSKLVYLVLYSALTVYFKNPLILLLLFVSTIPIVSVGKIWGRWGISIKGSVFFISFIFIFNFIAQVLSGSTMADAVLSGISMSIRFVALISIFATFFLTTSPEELTQSMVQLKIPYDYALTFNMAMRFVPTLGKEAGHIMDAQKSRGLELEKGNLMTRIRNYIPVLIPLIISSFRRAELVADAMESRAFGASKKRTSLYVLTMGSNDYLFIAISALSFLLLLSLNLFAGIA